MSYYRINVIPCYKPWRGGESPIYTKNKEAFDYFNSCEGIEYIYSMDPDKASKTEDDFETYDEYEEYLEGLVEQFHESEEVEFPITIIDECWVYTE